jgi:pimeloyl-ACP methyl ester carboxylesterase
METVTSMERVGSQWIPVDGLRIHYLTAGETGSPLLLLHGGGLDSAALTYRYAFGPLSQAHRVFAPDWPGYGQSDDPRGEATLEYYVRFLGLLMDALGLGQASLAGISLGGGIALGLALASPERVAKLVLANSYGLGWTIPGGALAAALVKLPLANALTWKCLATSRTLVRWSLRSIIHDPARLTDDLVDEVYQLVRKQGAGTAWRSFQRSEVGWGGLRTSYVNRLPRVAAPTLILHGDGDNLVPVAWAKRAQALIPDATLHVLPGCGHWLPRERPEVFNQAVLEFLAE